MQVLQDQPYSGRVVNRSADARGRSRDHVDLGEHLVESLLADASNALCLYVVRALNECAPAEDISGGVVEVAPTGL